MRKPDVTHAERILRVLRDGKPHTHLELYALGTVAHSRISDLRARGHVIEAWRDGDLYLYRLICEPSLSDPESPAWETPSIASSPGSGSLSEVARVGGVLSPEPPSSAISLTLFDLPVERTPAWS